MRIEKINEYQIKIVLSGAELAERNLSINELTYNNEKMQLLFHDMIEQALVEHSFHPENNSHLMLEASIQSADSVMIIVTKVSSRGGDDIDILNLVPRVRERQFRKRGVIEFQTGSRTDGTVICSCSNLDDMIMLCARLASGFSPTTELYKFGGRFYMIIRKAEELVLRLGSIDPIIAEYGQKHVSGEIPEAYLMEYSECIIAENAAAKLAQMA